MSANAALLRIFSLIPMPITPAMASLIQRWLNLGVPQELIVATVLDLLIGGDASERTSDKKQDEADAIALAVSNRENTASELRQALAGHEIVLRWDRWMQIVAQIVKRVGSLRLDQMAEVYGHFCAGEIMSHSDIDRILDRLLTPAVPIRSEQLDTAPGEPGLS